MVTIYYRLLLGREEVPGVVMATTGKQTVAECRLGLLLTLPP